MKKRKILLIDDDVIFLMLTNKLFKDQPFLEQINTASNVQAAFTYFKSLQEGGSEYPDAVFIDLDMPETSGFELAQQLKKTYLADKPETKLFILSSSISQNDRSIAEKLEAVDDYMEKPLSTEKLKQALGLSNG